jgi:drug/metabolite transporter (DMT)-like permease
MSGTLFSLILVSTALSAFAQICLKYGMSHATVTEALQSGDSFSIAAAIALNAWVVGGLMLYGAGAISWLFVLARVQVSYAYPFVAMGFILTMLLGKILLGDDLSLTRVVGTFIVVLGLIIVTQS